MHNFNGTVSRDFLGTDSWLLVTYYGYFDFLYFVLFRYSKLLLAYIIARTWAIYFNAPLLLSSKADAEGEESADIIKKGEKKNSLSFRDTVGEETAEVLRKHN